MQKIVAQAEASNRNAGEHSSEDVGSDEPSVSAPGALPVLFDIPTASSLDVRNGLNFCVLFASTSTFKPIYPSVVLAVMHLVSSFWWGR